MAIEILDLLNNFLQIKDEKEEKNECSREDLSKICELLSVKTLPDNILKFYQWSDGGFTNTLFGDGFWYHLSLDEVQKILCEWQDHTYEGDPIFSDNSHKFLPIATWNYDVFILVNLMSDDCFIYSYDAEDGSISEYKKFEDFLVELMDVRKKGKKFNIDKMMGLDDFDWE